MDHMLKDDQCGIICVLSRFSFLLEKGNKIERLIELEKGSFLLAKGNKIEILELEKGSFSYLNHKKLV